MSVLNSMTAEAIDSTVAILGDAFTELGGYGGPIDLATARDRITQVGLKLEKIAALLNGDVPVVVLGDEEEFCECELDVGGFAVDGQGIPL